MLRFLGNFLWFVLIGLWIGILSWIIGIVCCITVIGIPFGIQAFKIGNAAFLPFDKSVEMNIDSHPLMNIIWAVLFGASIAVEFLFAGILFCISIVGIPLGIAAFRMMKLSFFPFGATVEPY